MSETVKPPCVRGCTRPIIDPDTREVVGTEHRPATDGHLCSRCADTLRSRLTGIPELVDQLDTAIDAGGDLFQPGQRGKRSGSPALIRLEVAAMTDPRSVAVPRRFMGSRGILGAKAVPPDPAMRPEDVQFRGDVPGVLVQWADCLCDDLDLTQRPTTLAGAVELLTGPWWENLTYRPWIDELWTEVDEIHATLRRLVGVKDPVSVGSCVCGTRLFLPENGDTTIRCRKCGHRVDGLAVVRLKAAQTISEAG